MNPFSFFTRKVCLTVRDDEWQKGCDEFARVGLQGVQKFQALPIDDDLILGPHQSFNGSTNRILREFYESGDETLLFLEDDCQFKDLEHLESALKELPSDWDIVYLGANILELKPERHSEHISRVREAWTTHCIGYHRRVIPFILENQPGFSEQMYDNWISSQLSELKAYVVNPMVAWQRPHYSLIWQRDVNYDDVFGQSQARLSG